MRTISISQSNNAEDILRRGGNAKRRLTVESVATVCADYKVACDVRDKLSVTSKGNIERGADIVVFDDDFDIFDWYVILVDTFGLRCAWVDGNGYSGCSLKAPAHFWCNPKPGSKAAKGGITRFPLDPKSRTAPHGDPLAR
jgi:hypothetical protein